MILRGPTLSQMPLLISTFAISCLWTSLVSTGSYNDIYKCLVFAFLFLSCAWYPGLFSLLMKNFPFNFCYSDCLFKAMLLLSLLQYSDNEHLQSCISTTRLSTVNTSCTSLSQHNTITHNSITTYRKRTQIITIISDFIGLLNLHIRQHYIKSSNHNRGSKHFGTIEEYFLLLPLPVNGKQFFHPLCKEKIANSRKEQRRAQSGFVCLPVSQTGMGGLPLAEWLRAVADKLCMDAGRECGKVCVEWVE